MFFRFMTAAIASFALLITGCIPESQTDPAPNSAPTASMYFAKDTQSNVYNFDASRSSDIDNDTLSFVWEIDGKTFTSMTFKYTFSASGEYLIKLIVKDEQGLSSDQSVLLDVTMPEPENRQPNALIEYTKNTHINQYSFDASNSTDPDGDLLSYVWQIDNQRFESASFDYTFENAGTFEVTLIVDDGKGEQSTDSISINVTLPVAENQTPTAYFTVTKISDTQYEFDASQSADLDLDELTYQWRIDGKTFTTSTFTYEFDASISYEVELIVNDGQIDSTPFTTSVLVSIPVNNKPVIVPQVTSNFLEASFDASESTDPEGDDLSFVWVIDSTTYNDASVSHTFESAGTYLYSLSVSDLENTSVTSGSITVSTVDVGNRTPVAKMSINSLGLLISFSASTSTDQDGDMLTYQWLIDNQSYETVSGTHTFSQNGEYAIQLKVTDSQGDSHEISQNVTVAAIITNTIPVARFDVDITGLTVNLDAGASTDADNDAIDYLWTIDNKTFTSQTVPYTFSQAGNYIISLTVTDTHDASHSVSQSITVAPVVTNTTPVARFETDVNGFIVGFDASSSSDADGDALEYFWQFSGQNHEGVTTEYTFSTAQTYSIKLTVQDVHGAQHTVFGSVSVFEPVNYRPTAMFTATPDGLEVLLDASTSQDTDGTIDFYTWSIEGEDFLTTLTTRTHTFDQAGTYEILLTVEDDYGDTDTFTLELMVEEGEVVNAVPVPVILSTVQYGPYILFNGNNSYDIERDQMTYAWELSTGEVFNGGKYYYEAPSTASIEAKLILSDATGRAEATEVINPMSGAIDRDYDIELFEAASSYLKCSGCHNSSKPFTESGDMGDYDSDIRSRVSSSGIGVDTLYSYPVDRSSHNGSGTITTEENKTHWLNLLRLVDADVNNANQPPVPDFSYQVSETVVTFTNTSTDPENNNLTYEWDFGDFETSTETHPEHTFATAQMYVVKLTVNDGNTFKTIHKKITF